MSGYLSTRHPLQNLVRLFKRFDNASRSNKGRRHGLLIEHTEGVFAAIGSQRDSRGQEPGAVYR